MIHRQHSKMNLRRNQKWLRRLRLRSWTRPSIFFKCRFLYIYKSIIIIQLLILIILIFSYKTMAGSSSYRFGVLARIVRHMKQRHQQGDDHPLTLDEMLDETNQLDVGSKVKQVNCKYCFVIIICFINIIIIISVVTN